MFTTFWLGCMFVPFQYFTRTASEMETHNSHTDAALSGTDCSHCESFSLAFLRSRIAFLFRKRLCPSRRLFSSSQGPVGKMDDKLSLVASDAEELSGSVTDLLPQSFSSNARPRTDEEFVHVMINSVPHPPLKFMQQT